VIIHVTNHSISATCQFPVKGESWWKKGKLPTNLCSQFLVPENRKPYWSQGILNKWFKVEWKSARDDFKDGNLF
jgi:hypothetical protein